MNENQSNDHNKGVILLVDDQQENLKILSRLLRHNGYGVRPAVSGKLALRAATLSPPDLILLDIMMPELDGFEVCRQLKQIEQTQEIPIIFISALHDIANKVKAFAVGGVDYITKPFQAPEVLARVETHITLRNMQLQQQHQNVQLAHEIEQRRAVETTLRKSEQRYKLLFETMLNGYALHQIIYDDDGTPVDYRFLDINPAFERLTGLNRDVIGKTVLEVLPETEPYWIENYGQVALSGNHLKFEDYSHALGGKWFEVVAFSPRRGQFATLFQDITDRKKTDIELRKLSRAVEHSATPIVITDVNGIIEFVNPAFTKTTGYTATEAIGQKPSILKSGHHSAEFYQNMWNIITHGQIWDGEIRNRTKNGDLYWDATTIAPVKDQAGQITHFIAHKEDITERKQQETALKKLNDELAQRNRALLALQNISRTLATTWDIDEIYRVMHREVAQNLLQVPNFTLAAYDSDTQLITCQMSIVDGKLVDPAQFPPFPLGNGPISDTIRTRQPRLVDMDELRSQLQPLSHVKQIGDARPPKSGAYAPLIRNDQAIGVLFVQDYRKNAFSENALNLLATLAGQLAIALENAQLISELSYERSQLTRRVAQQTAELQTANAELSRAVRVKDEFLANMSHELRTPLNAILGMAEILRDHIYGPLNENQERSVQLIDESGQHLLALINDILDLSKIEAGKLILTRRQVVVEEVCQASIRFVNQQSNKKRVTLSLNVASTVNKIVADERRLKQILVNLLNNAVKFTPKGGKVSLDVSVNQEASTIYFIVSDTGVGISQESMQHLFQPFVQIDSSLSRQYDGTGLGLSLVYRLTDMHGGCIHLESEPGAGSKFTVVLPTNDEESDIALFEQFSQQTDGQPPHAISILLAEDVEPNIERFTGYLSKLGYNTVWVAKNGIEAVELAKEKKPDLIFMDLQMPVMDGLEAIRQIRADTAFTHVPIIGSSVLSIPQLKENSLAAGADAYLEKPIHPAVLLNLLKTHLPSQ